MVKWQPHSPVNRQTQLKTLPFPHSFAGGKRIRICLEFNLYPHRASASAAAAASRPIGMHCDTPLTLENRPPPNFQTSQCIPMDLDAAADTDARCVYTLTIQYSRCCTILSRSLFPQCECEVIKLCSHEGYYWWNLLSVSCFYCAGGGFIQKMSFLNWICLFYIFPGVRHRLSPV